MPQILTTCTFCGVGCGIYLETDQQRITGAYPSLSHPANAGRLCLRGWNVHEVASSPHRLRRPLLRRKRAQELEQVSWEEAFQFIAQRIQELIRRYGPESCAFFAAPRCSNEEAYLLQKLARAVIGTNHVDHGTGVYANHALPVLLEMLGVPASTAAIRDIQQAEVILVDHVDLGVQLPTIGGWVIRSHLRGAKLIVVDWRRHRIAEQADYFLQIRPGTDVWLYGAMAKVLLDRGWIDREFLLSHCDRAEEFLQSLQSYDLVRVSRICDVDPELIQEAALAYGRAQKGVIMFSTGGVARQPDSIRALINLALMRRNLGRPGAGILALAEHNNLQGVCDMGVCPNLLPGYVPVENVEGRQRLKALWGTEPPSRPGLGAQECFSGTGDATIRAVWLMRYDPISTATFCDARTALQSMDLVVVQDLFWTRAMEYADVILPLAAFGEEEGTFTSTERRIQRVRQAIPPPEGILPGWQQLVKAAQAFGVEWAYRRPAEVMEEIRRAVPFYSGADYENLDQEYGRQWPCTIQRRLGTPRLFADQREKVRFRLAPLTRPPIPDDPGPEFPFRLIFGQSHYYWHQNTLIQNSETLRREYRVLLLDYPEGFVELNPEDAKALEIRDGESIRLLSPTQSVMTTARVTNEVRRGTIFVPFFLKEVEETFWRNGALGLGNVSQPVFVRVEKGGA